MGMYSTGLRAAATRLRFTWTALLGFIGVLALVPVMATATVVYSQPSNGAFLRLSSQLGPDRFASDYDQYVWDDFAFASTQTITGLTWRGGYTAGAYWGGHVTDFIIGFYGSIAGGWQPDVINPPLVQYYVGGNAGETLVAGSMYDYAFTLPTPFTAAAGTTYWVQIEGIQNGATDWDIAAGSNGNNVCFIAQPGVGDFQYFRVPGDAALALLGPDSPAVTSTPTQTPTPANTAVPPTSTPIAPTNTAIPATNTPVNTMIPATATPNMTLVPSTPAAEDGGFIPPDAKTGKCEDAAATHLRLLATCITKCHVKQADMARKGLPFDEEACEQGSGQPTSCRALYDRLTVACSCPDAAAQAALADQLTNVLDGANAQIYCAGTNPLGGDDGGFVPPDGNTGKCEDAVAKRLGALAGCVTKCHVKQADMAAKGLPFDEETCEQGSGQPTSCRAAYDNVSATLLGVAPPICPACLDATAQGSLADLVTSFLEGANGQIYCAGTTRLP